ncbi:MAG: hypothetical protein V1746_05405, partial [bacterium]
MHKNYKYSITIATKDLAVLHCLRALSQCAQKQGNARIPWGGTKEKDWRKANCCATFHFSSADYRECFLKDIQR